MIINLYLWATQWKAIRLGHPVLIACVLFFTFFMFSCDSGNGNSDDGGNPEPTPSPTPIPTPSPGGSIIEPGGTLAVIPETLEYVLDGNERHKLDYYEISGLPSQTASSSVRGLTGARPALVFFHGGAWVTGDKADVDPLVFEAAETAGFHLISVGYRLAIESPWPAQIYDANAAVRWIKQNAEALSIDPDKIIIVGGSAGAHIGAAVAMASDISELQGPYNLEPPTSTDLAMAILVFGAYNLNMIVDDAVDLVGEGTCMVEDLVGIVAVLTLLDCPPSLNLLDPFMNCAQEDLDLASPEMFVDSMDPPTYLAHGRDDCTIPYQQTLGMGMALDGAGVPFSSIIVEGGAHSVDSLDLSVEEIISFIDENLSE